MWDLTRTSLGPRADLLQWIGAQAAELGVRSYLVGGPVRDLLVGAAVHDLDLCVQGSAIRVARTLCKRRGGELVQHPSFGTATWTLDGESIDLVTTRRETYARPGALPEITLDDLDHDLARRDFTVNAMALGLHPEHLGELVDPFSGRSDLDQRVLRILHGGSFVDDPTRLLRGARYAARFDLTPDPETLGAIHDAVATRALDTLSLERLGAELGRMLHEPASLRVLDEWGVLGQVAAGLRWGPWAAALESVDWTARWLLLACQVEPQVRQRRRKLVATFAGLGPVWSESPERLRAPGAEPGEWGAALRGASDQELQVLALRHPAPVRWWRETGAALRTVVDGRAVLGWGVRPGPQIGVAIAAAQVAAWRGLDADGQIAAARAAIA
jgi:tRNA nucleotidyltransferase/poly(A) polymerase